MSSDGVAPDVRNTHKQRLERVYAGRLGKVCAM
jgi:hypothetical protein